MPYCKIEVAIPTDYNTFFKNNAAIPNSEKTYHKTALFLTNAPKNYKIFYGKPEMLDRLPD